MTENYKLIADLAKKDVTTLEEKGKTYGGSWKKRGGIGAFMMLARKWDRIETICKEHNYDIFQALSENTGGIADDIEDLRCYLLLTQAHVESEVRSIVNAKPNPPWKNPLRNQPSHCQTCGSPGNHAGMGCPRALGLKPVAEEDGMLRAKHGPTDEGGPTTGYVDQDHDPYSRK